MTGTMRRTTAPMADVVMKPLWYSGASICCQTMSGNQVATTLTMLFMVAKTIARSSVSSVQISLAQLKKRRQHANNFMSMPIWRGHRKVVVSPEYDAGQAHMLAGYVITGPTPPFRYVPGGQGAEYYEVNYLCISR